MTLSGAIAWPTDEKKSDAALAESEGFEPPDLLQSTVFKTAAFDRSANSPDTTCSGSRRPVLPLMLLYPSVEATPIATAGDHRNIPITP